jgi:exodeoxyribonuclease VII small subunit
MTTSPESSFEESLAELSRIVQLLERGQPTLEQSLVEFERGVALLRSCRAKLDEADRRILELVDIDDQGRASLKPFSHQATADKGGENTPSPKRSRSSPKPTMKDSEPTIQKESEPGLFGS